MAVAHGHIAHLRPRHVDLGLVAVVALVVLGIVLGAWVLARGGDGRTRDEALVDGVLAAWSDNDVEAARRLYAKDAVLSLGPDDPDALVGRAEIAKTLRTWHTKLEHAGEPVTLLDPPGGFKRPDETVDQHYVVTPVLIHDDPFVLVLDVRNGKIATHMLFEPFEPFR